MQESSLFFPQLSLPLPLCFTIAMTLLSRGVSQSDGSNFLFNDAALQVKTIMLFGSSMRTCQNQILQGSTQSKGLFKIQIKLPKSQKELCITIQTCDKMQNFFMLVIKMTSRFYFYPAHRSVEPDLNGLKNKAKNDGLCLVNQFKLARKFK